MAKHNCVIKRSLKVGRDGKFIQVPVLSLKLSYSCLKYIENYDLFLTATFL